MAREHRLVELFLIALATILLEVSYTRIFSFKLVYFFTYVVIGLALLGVGTGGVLVALFRPHRRFGTDRVVAALSTTAAIVVAVGYVLVAVLPVNAFDMIRGQDGIAPATLLFEGAKLALASGALFLPFLCAGLVIAILLTLDPERAGLLYCADLSGAGVGCAASVAL